MKHLNRFRLNEEVKSGWEKIDYDGAGRFLDGVLSISGITTREDKISPKLLTQIYGLFSDTNNMEYKILVGSSFLGPHNTPQMWNRKDPSSNAMRIDLYKGDIHIFPYDDEWFLVSLTKRLRIMANEIWPNSQDGRYWFKCDQSDQLMDLIKQAIYYHNK
jgi:hypothetical protein